MNVLFYGPAGTGKTTKLLDEYIKLKEDNIFRNDVYYLVPTAEHADRIKILALAKINPLFADNIMTLDKFVCPQETLSESVKTMIFQYICTQLRSELKYFATALLNPAFFASLSELFSELRNYCIAWPEFYEKLGNSEKRVELEKIFTAYTAYLQEEKLHTKEYLAAKFTLPANTKKYILLDGFTEFTPLQYEILRKLNDADCQLYITLPFNQTGNEFFNEITTTIEQIKQLKDFQLSYLKDCCSVKTEELQFLAKHWGTKINPPEAEAKLPECENIKILTAGNRLQEIEAIAREILKYRQQGWSNIAVIFRSIGSYQFLINDVFLYYGIPVEIHEGITPHNQFIAWLLSLREIGKSETDGKNSLLALLKSSYSRLDQTQREVLCKIEADLSAENTEEICARLPQNSNYLQQTLALAGRLAAGTSFTEIKKVFEEFYALNNCAEILRTDSEHLELRTIVRHNNRAYTHLLEILDTLQVWQDKLKLTLSAEEIWQKLLYSLQEPTSSRARNGDQVQVYDALSARQKDYQIVFLADLTANSFPARFSETVLLKDYEKDIFYITKNGRPEPLLKQTAKKILNENLLFYQVLTRAQKKLYLCYAAKEAAGGNLNPSPFIKQLTDLLAVKLGKNIPIQNYDYAKILQNSTALCPQEFAELSAYRAYREYTPEEVAALPKTTKDLYILNELVRQKHSLQQNFSAASLIELQKTRSISAKKLEVYSRCQYRFFCEYVLKLQRKSDSETKFSINIGYILHDALQIYYSQGYHLSDKPSVGEVLRGLLQRPDYSRKLETTTTLHPRQIEVEYQRLHNILENFVRQDKDIAKARAFSPTAFEYNPEKILGKVFSLAGNSIPLVIDRIDESGQDFIVLDYKTSGTPALKAQEIKNGILPQVWIYLLAYQKLTGKTAAGAEYCSIKNPTKRPGLFADQEDFKTLLEVTEKNIKKYFADIQQGKFSLPKKTDPQFCRYCPAEDICQNKTEQTDDA